MRFATGAPQIRPSKNLSMFIFIKPVKNTKPQHPVHHESTWDEKRPTLPATSNEQKQKQPISSCPKQRSKDGTCATGHASNQSLVLGKTEKRCSPCFQLFSKPQLTPITDYRGF